MDLCEIIASLSGEQAIVLEEMKLSGQSAALIASWLSEEGFVANQKEIGIWLGGGSRTAPKTQSAARKKSAPKRSRGVGSALQASFEEMDADQALGKVQGLSLKLISELAGKCDREEQVSIESIRLLGLLPGLMRECRSAAAQKHEAKYIKDKKELQLAGAQRVCDILTLNFKDTPYAEGVEVALKGAMRQIEGEIE